MRIRFRPRVGPFVITPGRPAPPRPVSRGEDIASTLLVLGFVAVIGVIILACALGGVLS